MPQPGGDGVGREEQHGRCEVQAILQPSQGIGGDVVPSRRSEEVLNPARTPCRVAEDAMARGRRMEGKANQKTSCRKHPRPKHWPLRIEIRDSVKRGPRPRAVSGSLYPTNENKQRRNTGVLRFAQNDVILCGYSNPDFALNRANDAATRSRRWAVGIIPKRSPSKNARGSQYRMKNAERDRFVEPATLDKLHRR
jgi:hypothetical protein